MLCANYGSCLLAGQSAVGRLTFHLLNQYDQTGTQDFDFQYLLNDQPLFKKEIAIQENKKHIGKMQFYFEFKAIDKKVKVKLCIWKLECSL